MPRWLAIPPKTIHWHVPSVGPISVLRQVLRNNYCVTRVRERVQYDRIHDRAFIQNVVRSRKTPLLSALTLAVVADGEYGGDVKNARSM